MATVVGFIFGLGLVISGMVKRTKIVDFLTIYSGWDRNFRNIIVSDANLCNDLGSRSQFHHF